MKRLFCTFVAMLALTGICSAQRYIEDLPALPEIERPPPPKPTPPRREGDTMHFGNVRVDIPTKTVMATGWVNQIVGLIEVLACGPRGKTHESVFILDLNPLDFQAALLSIGLRGGKPMPAFGEGPPDGSPVDMIVEWQADGETRRERAEHFAWDMEKDEVLSDGPWTFTGSMVIDGEFMALAEESLIVTFWDPFAIINNPLASGVNDDILFVNTNTVPAYGTPVTFHISAAQEANPLAVTNHMAPDVPRIRYGL